MHYVNDFLNVFQHTQGNTVTILRLIFVVELKGRPLIPPSELMSQCAHTKGLCFLASLILSFFLIIVFLLLQFWKYKPGLVVGA